MGFLIVFLGGGFGAALRHGINLAAARLVRHRISLRDDDHQRHSALLSMGLIAEYFALQGAACRSTGGCF